MITKFLRVRLFGLSPVGCLSIVTLALVLFLSPQNVSSIFAGIRPQNSYLETTMSASHSTYALSYNIATSCLNRGMIDEAISEYRMVLNMNPDYAKAHNNLAVAYFAKECLDLAWKHVRIAQKLNNPPHSEFLKLLKKASEVNQQ